MVLSAKVLALASSLTSELAEIHNSVDTIKERRLALLAGRQAQLKELANSIHNAPESAESAESTDPAGLLLAAEALLSAGVREKAAMLAAKAALHGFTLPRNAADAEWHALVANMQQTEWQQQGRRALATMQQNPKTAQAEFSRLAKYASGDFAAGVLANLVLCAQIARQQGTLTRDIYEMAKKSLAELRTKFPNYIRLASVEAVFSGLQAPTVSKTQ